MLVSAVLFEDSRIVPELPALAAACADAGAELLVDAYHALGCLPFTVAGLERAWIVGGGYKYLQLGEGNCFLRLPPQADELRPGDHGLVRGVRRDACRARARRDAVPEGEHALRRARRTTRRATTAPLTSSTSSTSRALPPNVCGRATSTRRRCWRERFDELGLSDVTRDRDTPLDAFGGFLALESERAEELSRGLLDAGVVTDSRGRYLRLGPAPYHSDEQLETAIEELGRVARG